MMNNFLKKHWTQIEKVVDSALLEDAVGDDITTTWILPQNLEGNAHLLVNSSGIVAGLDVFTLAFKKVDSTLITEHSVGDGAKVSAGQRICSVRGSFAGILGGERVALNFVQRLSGIATETSRYVEAIKGTKARILDTRKTTPGLRLLEKYAVTVGGGYNHRMNLQDGILIKDNHKAALKAEGIGLVEAIIKVRNRLGNDMKVEVEVESIAEAEEALLAGADVIMVDNMNIDDIRKVVTLVNGKALIEASGGITLDNVRNFAETDVDFVSIGAITHSVRILDMSLELEV